MKTLRAQVSPLMRQLSAYIASAVLVACVAPALAQSQAYPIRPLRLIVPFPPGGSTDIYARVIAPKLSEALGQQIVVDNRAGAGGAIGAGLAAAAVPDGYTIWLGQTNNLAIGPALRPKSAYDPVRDFSPITLLMQAPQVLVVSAESSINSVKDLIAAAKKNPGGLTYGSAGIGSSGHINGFLFNQVAGVNIIHVPYKGATPAMIDLRAGRITLLATSLASAAALMKDGKIRPLATTGAKRVRMLPDTPTVAESGLPGYEMSSWHGMLAPAKVPAEIVARLNHEIVRVLKLPDVQEKLLSEGGDITPTTPQEFAAFLKSEVAKWSKILKQAGVTLD
jgi:tripartite-type tricarboxylate transporter receptor subunit TctC